MYVYQYIKENRYKRIRYSFICKIRKEDNKLYKVWIEILMWKNPDMKLDKFSEIFIILHFLHIQTIKRTYSHVQTHKLNIYLFIITVGV